MKTASRLEKILESGAFAVTSECGPPRGSDPQVVRDKGELLRGSVDAINVTDNQTSVVRMSSIAACVILKEMGLEPICQMTTRDRNRIAIQSDLLGAAALGMSNLLCLSGDHQRFGDHPTAKNVYDIDSIQLIHAVHQMREEGKFINGEEIKTPPKFFIGAAANPFADPFAIRVPRLAKKAAAGVDFIQTQCIYNMDKFKEWMKGVVDRGLHEKVKILAGVTPMKSVGMAQYMKRSVPGMDVPDAIIKRLRDAGKGNAATEGVKFCVEQIQELKEMEGVAGIHLMAIEWEEKVPEMVKAAGLSPRPEV
jgi:methylenetetrahydrofolate reductase (NADPH)